MYLYNVTVIAENDIREAVKQYLNAQFFGRPDDMLSLSFLEVLDSPHEGTTYCIQLRTENSDDILSFQQQHWSAVQELLSQRHPGKILFFDSKMKYLND